MKDYPQTPIVQKDENTITLQRSHFYAGLIPLAFAVGLLLGYLAWGRGTSQTAAQPTDDGSLAEAPIVTSTPRIIRYPIPTEGFPSIGPADAPIVIVEFSDYECPFCKRWHDEVYQPLMAAYPGKIRLVFRNFPLTSLHANAFPASEAALCAGDQGAYWPFHDKLFTYADGFGEEVYLKYATELGLDNTTFNDCITNNKHRSFVQDDIDFAVDLGISSTPTFFINGLAVVGAQPVEVFKQVIDKELAGELPQ